MRWLSLIAVLGSACATSSGPEQVAADFRAALKSQDAGRVLALSDGRTQRAWSQAQATPTPEQMAALARAPDTALVEQDGQRILLVRESEGWRVQSMLLPPQATEAPQALLQFLTAIRSGHWAWVRTFIPEDRLAAYTSDEALAAHLEPLKPTLGALAEALAQAPVRATADRVEIVWGPGQTAVLLRRGQSWKVWDIQ